MPLERLDGIVVPENTYEMERCEHHDEWRHLFNAIAPKIEQREKITTEIIEYLWDSYQTLSKEAGGEFLTYVSREYNLSPKTLTGYLMICFRAKRDLWWDPEVGFGHIKKVGEIRALSAEGRRRVLESARRNGWTVGRTGKAAIAECGPLLPGRMKKLKRIQRVSGRLQESAIKNLIRASEAALSDLPDMKAETLRDAIDAVKTAVILPTDDL